MSQPEPELATAEPLYCLKQGKSLGEWYLSKFEAFEPEYAAASYYMQDNGKGGRCGCPSPKSPCKHQPIRLAILTDGRPLHSIGYRGGKVVTLGDVL